WISLSALAFSLQFTSSPLPTFEKWASKRNPTNCTKVPSPILSPFSERAMSTTLSRLILTSFLRSGICSEADSRVVKSANVIGTGSPSAQKLFFAWLSSRFSTLFPAPPFEVHDASTANPSVLISSKGRVQPGKNATDDEAEADVEVRLVGAGGDPPEPAKVAGSTEASASAMPGRAARIPSFPVCLVAGFFFTGVSPFMAARLSRCPLSSYLPCSLPGWRPSSLECLLASWAAEYRSR